MNNSSKREKILLVITGIMLLVISIPVINYLYGPSALKLQRHNEDLKQKISELDERIVIAKRGSKELAAEIEKALPNDNDHAASLYKNWLLELTGKAGFEKRQIESSPAKSIREARAQEDQYRNHQFTVRGQGSFEQFGEFLRLFYSVDQLHLIRSISLKPIDTAKRLDIVLTIEALNIPGTKNTELVTTPNPRTQEISWSEMIQTIAGRNFFAPHSPASATNTAGETAQSKKVDPTPYTYVNAIVWLNGSPQVWINLRTEGEKYRLSEGETFNIGTTKCTVKKIHDRSVEVEAGGVVWAIKLGTSFVDGVEVLGEESENEQTSDHS